MAAVMRLRPDARKLWFSNVRSRISPWRWKNTARRSALLASPLLRPAWLRWRNTGTVPIRLTQTPTRCGVRKGSGWLACWREKEGVSLGLPFQVRASMCDFRRRPKIADSEFAILLDGCLADSRVRGERLYRDDDRRIIPARPV